MKSFRTFLESKDPENRSNIYSSEDTPHPETYSGLNDVSKPLIAAMNKKSAEHNFAHDKHLSNYTSEGSRRLNTALIRGFHLTDDEKSMHEAIHTHKHEAGVHFHLYSGTSFNPKELAEKSEDKILHSPAHISGSHDLSVAVKFAGFDKNNISHMMHVAVKPHNKVAHMDGHSEHREQESVIPSDTKLKYLHTTYHKAPSGKRIDVHHFEIHHQ